jgi:hypothetical protein
LPPSGAGADFSFASSDFKTLGAFFCNFPSLDWRRLQSRRRVGQRERRAGAGEAARLDRLSVRRAGEASEILSRFRAFQCFARRKISFRPHASNSTTFLRLSAAAHGQPRARVPDVVAQGFRDHTNPGRGFNLFKPLRRHFRATPLCRQSLSRRATFCAIESIPSKERAAAGARHREQSEATQTRGLQLRLGLDTCSPCSKLRPLVPMRAYRTWPDRGCTKAKAPGGVGHAGSCHEF